jgi:hypothetical protein
LSASGFRASIFEVVLQLDSIRRIKIKGNTVLDIGFILERKTNKFTFDVDV